MSTHAHREAKPRQGGANVSTQDLLRLDGRTIIRGGGAMGLNAAISILEQGGDVICIDRMSEPLSGFWTKAQMTATEHNKQLWYKQHDISNADDTLRVFEEAFAEARHPLRGIVACAGISDGGASLYFSPDRVRALLDVNVTGTFVCAQAAAKIMHRSPDVSTSMVLIASMSGHISNKGVDTAAYNASKAAVQQLARSLAAEWGSRSKSPLIRVNSISPGYIRTRMTAETLAQPGMEELWCGDNMMYRIAEIDEFRGPIVFLLSDASSAMTGSDLRVDLGHTAW